MARYQSLPDRTDTFSVTVSDQHMCQNYGLVIDCCTVPANTKCQLNITTACGCCYWCVPAGVQSIYVEIWAGGGGGSGSYCICCIHGTGGGAGGYQSFTLPTAPGCKYTVCAGSGGVQGCGFNSPGGAGNTSYISGFNTGGGACALGGMGALCTCCSNACGICGSNQFACGTPGPGPSAYANNVFGATGEVGHQFGRAAGCGWVNRGGSAPFNGGAGATYAFFNGANGSYVGAPGGNYPGGGAAGAASQGSCSICQCGGCGGNGLVRIWY